MKFQNQVPVRSLKKIFTSSERNTLQSRKFSKIFNKTIFSLCDALKAIFHYGRFRLKALGKLGNIAASKNVIGITLRLSYQAQIMHLLAV